MFERRQLDHPESLIAAAGAVRIDRRRFEKDLDSPAIAEVFDTDLDEVRDPPDEARDAAVAAGAGPRNEGPLEPLDVIRRFGRCATRELGLLSGRRSPALEADLWALARDRKIVPVSALSGTIWERA
jgi:hypothetical protein